MIRGLLGSNPLDGLAAGTTPATPTDTGAPASPPTAGGRAASRRRAPRTAEPKAPAPQDARGETRPPRRAARSAAPKPRAHRAAERSARALRTAGEKVRAAVAATSLTTLESRFEEVLHDVRARLGSEGGLEAGTRRRMEEELRLFGARMAERIETLRSQEERDRRALASARWLLSIDALVRFASRGMLRRRSLVVDAFGYDGIVARRLEPALDFLFDRYFRTEVRGVEAVPAEGPAILVANHAGVIPFDGPMISTAVRRRHEKRRDVRWLVEDEAHHFPFFGVTMARLGAVRACPENALLLLERGSVVAVFPEGSQGLRKRFTERYRLRRFGRGGVIKLALRSGAPLVPVAVVGGEETYPLLGRTEFLARSLGVPFLPFTPTFPWLGPLGLLPLPTRWSIQFGDPIRLEAPASAVDDPGTVSRLNERIRGKVQGMVRELLSRRKGVFA